MIGQCNNTITYERRKNILLGVTGTTSSQAASMLKEKTVFLQKHDQALLGKYFRDHLTKSLEAKKQSIEAIAEVSKSTNRKRPFREGPSFYQGRPKIQKFRSNYSDKYILFQKKGTLSQQQSNFTSSYDKHGGINSRSSNSKKINFQTKNSKMCRSREVTGISPSLETTDKRSKALGFSRRLPNSSSNGTSTGEGSKSTKVKSGTTKISRSGSKDNAGKGLSLKRRIFEQLVSDQQKRWREPTSHKFEGSKLVHSPQTLQDGRFALSEVCVTKRGFVCKTDLKDAYFSVPLHKDSRKLVRFLWAGYLYEFRCLCFGLGPARRIFTKLLKVPISVLRRLMISVINYLDDLLIWGNRMSEIFMTRDFVIFLLQQLGFVINLKKCVLDPQEIEFLRLIVNSQTMTLSLPQEKIGKVKDQCLSLYKASEVSLLDLTKLI